MSLATLRVTLAAVPASVLLVAYAAVGFQAGSAWPWTAVVHEDGQRTLLGTIFFVEHATRELLLDLVLAAAIAGAMVRFFGGSRTAGEPARRFGRRLAGVAAVVALAILIGTAARSGASGLLENLAQLYTRPGAPGEWGSHWRYHLLSRLAVMLLAYGVAGALAAWVGMRPGRRSARLFGGSLVVFGGLTGVFGLTSEPFLDPRFLGHQARELMTHTIVTVPFGLWACFLGVRGSVRPRGQGGRVWHWSVPLAVVTSIVLGGYLAVGVIATDAQAQGQADGLAALVFPHVFEHTLTYVLVPFAAAGLFLLWDGARQAPVQQYLVKVGQGTESAGASAPHGREERHGGSAGLP